LKRLIDNCKSKPGGESLIRKIDELLEWQKLFSREEQNNIKKRKQQKQQDNYQKCQKELRKAKNSLKNHLNSKEIEVLLKQKEKVVKLEMLAKILKKTDRYKIQEEILNYLQKEWSYIHPNFQDKTIEDKWISNDFTWEEARKWFNIINDLDPKNNESLEFLIWLREHEQTPEKVLNMEEDELKDLKDEFNEDQQNQVAQVLHRSDSF